VITHLFLVALSGFARAVMGLFPPLPDPDPVIGSASSGLGTVFGYAGQFGGWIPWATVAAALAVVVAVLAAAGVIKLVRIGASFLTLGGGSAA
jgi:hypothetical protein